MLKKQHRGLSSGQITELFEKADGSVGNRFFRVNWMKIPEANAQFIVIANTKLSKQAVVRNRLRRQCYSLISKHFSGWTRGARVAILVKQSTLDLSPVELAGELRKILRQARLL